MFCSHDLNTVTECIRLDSLTFKGMNTLDYLAGSTDRHPESWSFLVDKQTNRPVSLYPIMDFNQSFHSYESINGDSCQAVFPWKPIRREAVK